MERYALVNVEGDEKLVGPFDSEDAVSQFEAKLAGAIEIPRHWDTIKPQELERLVTA